MTLKLTKSQLQALEQALKQAITYEHVAMEDKLLVCILTRLYKRLVVKLLDLKNKYTITFDAETAMAFYLYFSGEVYIPTSLEGNTLKMICNQTEKIYA